MDNQREIIEEFLIESNESLAQLDQDFVALEKRPNDQELLSSIFRTIHTIKGVSGFLGFTTLGALTHRAESILSQLRDGDRTLTEDLTDLLLESFDAVKGILAEIEKTSTEGADDRQALIERLKRAGNRDPFEQVADSGRVEAPLGPEEHWDGEREGEGNWTGRETGEQSPRPSVADANIRVSVDVLDDLMNLVGELVLARNQVLQLTAAQEDAGFIAAAQRLNQITAELQAKVMKARMQPIRAVWSRFPRVIRDLGQAFSKQIELVMEGAGTELDKAVVEAIKDPLTHIVRNSCDHGIEPPAERLAAGKPAKGRLSLRASHEGGQVNIEVSDDGRGIDPERIREAALARNLLTPERAEKMSESELANLVFLPGLSTAREVTSMSGRGVGMDVVRASIEKIGGSIDLQSRRCQGTTIKIRIPLTLAIIPALVVICAGERFAIPQADLLELIRAEPGLAGQRLGSIHGAPVYRLRGKLLPLIDLRQALRLDPSGRRRDQPINIVVLQADGRRFGLLVDDVRDTVEIVVKPLSKLLKGLSYYAGATVMGDGRVALILDVKGLAQAGKVWDESKSSTESTPQVHAEKGSDRQKLLLFRCGDGRRLAAPLALIDRLEKFAGGRIECAGQGAAVQYRDSILPLIRLGDYIEGLGEDPPMAGDRAQVIVLSDGARRFGVIVDEIIDIVEESVSIRARGGSAGLLGSAVIGGRLADLIDVRYLIERIRIGDAVGGPAGDAQARVLVVDSSAFSRGLLRGELEMAGHRVLEAINTREALERLSRDSIDVVVSSLDLPGAGARKLLRKLRQTPAFARIPAIGLHGEDPGPVHRQDFPAFDELRNKADREAVLDSVTRLACAAAQAEYAGIGG